MARAGPGSSFGFLELYLFVAVRENRKLQQVMVAFARAVAAVARGLVTLPIAELD